MSGQATNESQNENGIQDLLKGIFVTFLTTKSYINSAMLLITITAL